MRGKETPCIGRKQVTGITPAYAGKRFFQHVQFYFLQDHPRLCGEKVRQSRTCGSGQGSPPPMRGKGQLQLKGVHRAGITPAYAGKRSNGRTITAVEEDHPRLCGEKTGLSSILRTE